ncbi:hypothetical protein KGF56_002082 [Candida oxycetoniae]|uniref:Uncharacterized protein n=1 Tax=Candida oxycetoniae TaxID=497107 RepID=A0AAI9SZC5_9ASCO|nr:uncharacterized protein KGF56_002082 [Candida oxycetoniae]KAI3405126.2 hypothetical protein KGF56_002082 [Candida oxycetoniae]
MVSETMSCSVALASPSDALIEYSSYILEEINDLLKVEYNKKGRKYRVVNNTLQRIRQEDKHLIICPEQLELKLSFYSAFMILYNIGNGEILTRYPEFCCTILSLAQTLEENHWYEEENSSVLHLKNSKIDPRQLIKEEADKFIEQYPLTETHTTQGINLLICSKLNFLHTDHHIGTKLEGYYMKFYIEKYFNINDEALSYPDVLIALKSCVHWGNIKGILYKLEVPHIQTTPELIENFKKFPDPSPELKQSVYERYPSGTSKYCLLKKSIETLADSPYAQLIPFDQTTYPIEWLYRLCKDIESNPIKYHLRSKAKQLSDIPPVSLAELTMKYNSLSSKLFQFIALAANVLIDSKDHSFLQNSKIPKLNQELINENDKIYKYLVDLRKKIDIYETKSWGTEDIVARLQQEYNHSSSDTLFAQISELRQVYARPNQSVISTT